MEQYKNHILFITLCIGFVVLFIKPWALICAGSAYALIRYLNYSAKLSKDEGSNSTPTEKSSEDVEETIHKNMGFDTPEKEEFINQKDIDELLNSGQAESKFDPFDPKNQ